MEDLQHHLLPFALDVFRLVVWLLLLMIVFVPLERLFSLHDQKVFRKAFRADLGYYFVNGIVTKLLLILPMAVLAWVLHYFVPGRVHAWAAALPIWARLMAALVVGEVGFYWGHRWTHEIPFLWRFHAIHHSAEEIDWLVNTRGHPFDIVFVRLCGFVPMYAIGLAQPMAGRTIDFVPLLILTIGSVWGYFIHSNIRWRFGWIGLLISTPAFHHWHHTNDENIDKNYASMLPIMDKIFGTWYMPKKQWPTKYGTDTVMAQGIAAQLLQPLQPSSEKAEVPAEVAGQPN